VAKLTGLTDREFTKILDWPAALPTSAPLMEMARDQGFHYPLER
jgi:hypothetical protein